MSICYHFSNIKVSVDLQCIWNEVRSITFFLEGPSHLGDTNLFKDWVTKNQPNKIPPYYVSKLKTVMDNQNNIQIIFIYNFSLTLFQL